MLEEKIKIIQATITDYTTIQNMARFLFMIGVVLGAGAALLNGTLEILNEK